ncbi:bis(5'-adenosyl)-triphosphatase enpp4-like isoform X2 [Harmonia axyridis]|uniref:bis(5'-adenosyl)-triphosphatase enpp4-like isoform X2 n=1 Tax=Harmonia axyridis TaxID=115357 RepID=UPI001E279C6C|nr:bis(5'-adenosyl)-triphosphatase enpp4-like isoform X2 [Harmonia axyridis]
MIRAIILHCFFINLIHCISEHPILIVVSYDALRYNYFDTKRLPLTEKMREYGTYADYLINVFPTKTFPNHHSIATGLYVEKHGVIGNTYWEPKENKKIGMSYQLYHYNEDIVPIWRYNEANGRGRYSGSMMWPGASFPYQNKNITHIVDYNPQMDFNERIDKVISWIRDPEKPANLVMVYFEEPDNHGHAFGPNSNVFKDILVKMDNLTQYLEDQLKRYGLKDKVHVIHTSDHGMVPVAASNILNITKYLEPGTYQTTFNNPLMDIIPKEGYEDKIYNNLKAAADENENFKVYRKRDYLDRWHFKNNPRIAPIYVMAEVGYALDGLARKIPYYESTYNISVSDDWEFGVHGYDYTVSDMNPFFMVRGPNVKINHKVPPFHTVDLFHLFCLILKLPMVANDGREESVRDILIYSEDARRFAFSKGLLITGAPRSIHFHQIILVFNSYYPIWIFIYYFSNFLSFPL